MFIFSVSLSFSLSLFWPPSFCVSLSLSLFFLLFFLSSFLSLFFAVFWFLVFVSFFLFLSSLLFFHERNNIKKLNCKFFSSSIFSLFLVSCLFFFQVPFSYLCYFLILSYVFCSTSRFWFQNRQLRKKKKNRIFWSKGGLQQNGFFFLSTSVLQNVKSYRFFRSFFGKFWVMFKKHYKNRYFSTFLKAKKGKQKWPFLIVTNWATGHVCAT